MSQVVKIYANVVGKAVKFSNIACSINLHYLILSRGNFYGEKQHSSTVLPFGARGSGNYASPCIMLSTAGKVTEGIAESNGSLPPDK